MPQYLSLGLVSDESINFDDAEEIDKVIHANLDGRSVAKCIIKRSDQVKLPGICRNVVKIKN